MSEPTRDASTSGAAMALLDRIHANGGTMTFRVQPDSAETFHRLQELKAAGLIEEIPSGKVLDYRYRLTDAGKVKFAEQREAGA